MNAFLNQARAVALTSVSDTLSDSDLSASSQHAIRYTSTNDVTAGQTIKVQFDPTGDLFTLSPDIATSSITIYGATLQTCSGPGTDEVNVRFDTTAADENIIFEVCAGDTVPAGAITIITATSVIANPSAAQSYVIRIAGTQTDSADLRVAVIDDVVVTAAVDTTLTFVIEGLYTATTNVVNGQALSGNTSPTGIPFGTLQVGVAKTLGQKLRVTTNAVNGFAVTVQQDGALRSQTGATIDNFQDGVSSVTPIAWTTPTNIFNQEGTYGHIGMTSEDDLVTGGDIWGSTPTPLWSGAFQVPREVFYHFNAADGVTYGEGQTNVAYRVQIASLQEAATDYTMTLTYVATPIF